MKLNENFILHISDGETLLVPTGAAEFSGIVRGNKTLGAVLALLKEETDEAAVVAAMKARFSAPEETVTRDVKKVLDELKRIGAITV